jgi:hypothetical protein
MGIVSGRNLDCATALISGRLAATEFAPANKIAGATEHGQSPEPEAGVSPASAGATSTEFGAFLWA